MTDSTWLAALREACTARGQADVARQLGYSAGAISAVLAGKYQASTARLQAAVEGALLLATVDCPVLGELPRQRCVEHQRRGFAATNPMRVALSRACPDCPHRSMK